MYSVSGTFLTKIKESSRIVKAKVEINSTTLTEVDIVDFQVESSIGADGLPTIGSASSNKLTLNLIKSGNIPAVLIGVPIKPSVAIDIGGGTYEWVPMGVFYATTGDVQINNQTIAITCFDKLSTYDTLTYTSALTYPASVQSVISEIGTTFGITFETQTLPSVNIPFKLTGTVRTVLSQIAWFISRNCTMNRLGQVKFIFTNASGFSLDANNYATFSLSSASMSKISELSVVKTDETEYHSGNSTGLNTEYETDIITSQASLDTVFNRIYPLDFYSYNMSLQGMPHMDVGDTFTFTDKDSVVRTLIIVTNKFKYAGGLTSEFSVDSPKEAEKTTTVTAGGSTLAQAVDKIYTNTNQAILNASNLITGNNGGYVITVMDEMTGKPKELVIANTDDINTATKVWRWNNSGLGYSSTGYNGTYGTAITQDGQIVANFITTGELSADRINGGTLILGGTTNVDGQMKVKDASGNVIIGADTTGLAVYDNTMKIVSSHITYNPDGTIAYGSYESHINLGAWEITHGYMNTYGTRSSSFSISGEGVDCVFQYGADAVFSHIHLGIGDTANEKNNDISCLKFANLRLKEYYETTETYILDIDTYNSKIISNYGLTIVTDNSTTKCYGGIIEIGRIDGTASTPYIDFHSGATLTDFDSRIIATGGNGANGQGTLNLIASVVQYNGNTILSTANTNYKTWDGWLRENGDDATFKQYGNSRCMVFRTDGTTAYGDNGAYPFIWLYGGDASATNKKMMLNTDGTLWTSSYGWLDDKFWSINTTTAGDINLDVSGGERHIRSHDTGHDWGFYFSTGGFGAYDWTNSRTIFSYGASTNTLTMSTPVTTSSLTVKTAGNAGIEVGRVDGTSSTPFIDFHSGATACDYDSRLLASGGTGTNGAGTLNVVCSNLQINGNNVVDVNDFASSKSTNCYQKFPSGLILQCGTFTGLNGGYRTVTFPIAFPSYCRSVVCTPIGFNATFTVNTIGVSSFALYVTGDGTVNITSNWFAMGY